jgi:hypothetical protein
MLVLLHQLRGTSRLQRKRSMILQRSNAPSFHLDRRLGRYSPRVSYDDSQQRHRIPMSEVQMKNQAKPVCSITTPENRARMLPGKESFAG